MRKSISGKTNYLIVSLERDSDSKYKAVLEQDAKGHTVEVIFYEDFVKYMGDNIADIEEDINDDSLVGNDKVGTFANQETADASRMSEISDQLQSLTSQMQSGFSDMLAFVEHEKLRLEEEERIAQEVYDKAMQTIGVSVKTSPSSYSSRLTESVYVRSNYDTMSSFYGDDDSYDDSPKKKEGCYIATAIYGSYDAPEVITLRQFHDETLKKPFFGRMFIKVYYTLSPPVAEKLKNAHRVNTFVRSILDKWVVHLNSK